MAIVDKIGKERVAKCSYCDRPFSKLEHAQRHERTHTRDRPFKCETCGKDFARADTLNRHKRLHTRDEDGGSTTKTGRGRKRKNSDATASARPAAAATNKSAPRAKKAKLSNLDPQLNVGSSAYPELDPTATLLGIAQGRRLSDSHLVPPVGTSPPPQPHSRRHTIANPPPQHDASYASLLGLQLDMQPSDIAHLERSFIEPSPLEEFLSATSSMSYSEEDAELPSRSHSAASYSGTFDSNSGEAGASPSFSSLSPAEELEAILANDPLHARRHTAHVKDFDYHTLAGNIEGASPAPSGVQPHSTLFEDLLGIVAKESEVALRQPADEQPPSTSAAGPAFRTDFDFIGEPAPFLTPQVSTTAELYPVPPPAHTRRASFTTVQSSSKSGTTTTSASTFKPPKIPAITMPTTAANAKAPAGLDMFVGPAQPSARQISPPVNPTASMTKTSSAGASSGSAAFYIPTVAEQMASASPMWQNLLPTSSSGMDSPTSSGSFVKV